jgi:A/G-specific adenine glycosylase
LNSTQVGSLLLPWFRHARRDLPWRNTRDPYHIWVSEIMLQQTQVDTVIPYYHRFLERHPTVFALAQSDLESVLKSWEGLGYYARARNLHRAAQAVAASGGQVPLTWEAIRRLPGIGDYTAGAILSIAYGVKVPVLDGNVRRVLSRLYAEDGDPKDARTVSRLQQWATDLVEQAPDPSLHNQAMMELGALVCGPARPRCGECPLQSLCQGARSGHPETYPRKVRRPRTPHYDVAVGAILDEAGRVLIGLRPPRGLLGGLWELPGGKMEPGETAAAALVREAGEELGIDVEVLKPLVVVHHAYTHFKVTLHSFLCRWTGGEPRPIAVDEFRWVEPEHLDRYPFPKANKVILQALQAAL